MLVSGAGLAEAGLRQTFTSDVEKVLVEEPGNPILAQERRLMVWSWDAAFETTRWRSLTHSHYVHSSPEHFAGLLSDSPIQVKETLGFCKRMWKAV